MLNRSGALLALGFLAFGLVALDDYSVTMDEGETYAASEQALRAVTTGFAGGPFEGSPHDLPGYYFPFDLVRGAVARLLVDALHWTDVATAHHLVHLLLAAASILLLHGLALRISGSRRVAVFAAMALATLPKFVAHSQANPKDLPALFATVLAIHAFARLRDAGGLRAAAVCGAAFGLSLATREQASLLAPIAVLWALAAPHPRGRPTRREMLTLVGTALATFVAAWPWLWAAPVSRLAWALSHVAGFSRGPDVLYLGTVYPSTGLPWHYTLVSILVSTTLFHLAAVALGAASLLPRFRRAPGVRPLALLGATWCAVPLASDLLAHAHYDGVRHVLLVLPGIALLAGVGMSVLVDMVATTSGRLLAGVALGAAFLHVVVSLAAIHPYQDAYLNEVTNELLPGPAEEYLEVEYWGFPYKEGAQWIDAHAEPDARVFLLWSAQANFHLAKPGLSPAEANFNDPSVPGYLMIITRRAFYNEFTDDVERRYPEAFAVRRQRATLLRIFKNQPAER